jgi:leucine dehydrogenase
MSHRQDVFSYAQKLGFGELHFEMNSETGLFAIVALHNTKRGPALGGTRWLPYNHINDAIYDALRLARGMTYKSAICRLPHGGGKAVIIRPSTTITDRDKYFAAYAKFIDELGGNYITAVDSGTTPTEMDLVAKYTRHVTSTTKIGNPSPFTAHGVLRGIEAAVKAKMNKNSIKGLHICIQGLGQVGHFLAKECHKRGAKLTLTDTNPIVLKKYANEFKAKMVKPENIYRVPCDVFSPCALGGILNHLNIAHIDTAIIAGAANNQLKEAHDGKLLHRMDILYAPDYVINSGGLIHASGKYYGASDKLINEKIDHIYDALLTIFQRSQQSNIATSEIADQLAIEMIEQEPEPWKK